MLRTCRTYRLDPCPVYLCFCCCKTIRQTEYWKHHQGNPSGYNVEGSQEEEHCCQWPQTDKRQGHENQASQFLHQYWNIPLSTTITCRRLGNVNPDRIQPLLISLPDATIASDILREARILRRSTDPYVKANVYVNPDRTKAEGLAAFELRVQRRKARGETPTNSLNGSLDPNAPSFSLLTNTSYLHRLDQHPSYSRRQHLLRQNRGRRRHQQQQQLDHHRQHQHQFLQFERPDYHRTRAFVLSSVIYSTLGVWKTNCTDFTASSRHPTRTVFSSPNPGWTNPWLIQWLIRMEYTILSGAIEQTIVLVVEFVCSFERYLISDAFLCHQIVRSCALTAVVIFFTLKYYWNMSNSESYYCTAHLVHLETQLVLLLWSNCCLP